MMTKLLLHCLILNVFILFFAHQLSAQAALLVLLLGDKVATEKFHFSLDAGLNFAAMPGLDGKVILQPNFGLGIHLKINDHWYFVPEFKPLSGKGAKEVERIFDLPDDIENAITSIETSLRLNYIDVPLLAQYRLNDRIYFSAGPQISFLTGAEYVTEATLDNGNTLELEEDVKSEIKTVDFGFPVEVAYAVSTARNGKGIDLRLRYTPGFNQVFSDASRPSARNSIFQVIVAFPFIESGSEE